VEDTGKRRRTCVGTGPRGVIAYEIVFLAVLSSLFFLMTVSRGNGFNNFCPQKGNVILFVLLQDKSGSKCSTCKVLCVHIGDGNVPAFANKKKRVFFILAITIFHLLKNIIPIHAIGYLLLLF
jgi:hypothetical protein